MSNAPRINPDLPSKQRARIGRDVAARLNDNAAVRPVPLPTAQIWRGPGFLSEAECAALIPLIDADLRPSAVLAEGDWTSDYRSSETCDLVDTDGSIAAIDRRIADLLGIPLSHGETLQGQRYLPGQHFRAHCDWFESGQPYWPAMERQGGQRIWTAMVYLNEVEEGGATWFPQAGARFRPSAGMLLAWNNMKPDGSPNPDTIHEGMRVAAGAKYILTKWFREGPWHNSYA